MQCSDTRKLKERKTPDNAKVTGQNKIKMLVKKKWAEFYVKFTF